MIQRPMMTALGLVMMLAACATAPQERAAPVMATAAPDTLLAGFVDPPNAARPRVWWHWMNGNITQEGIAADLAWMDQVGIGGVQNFDANLSTPQVVDQRLVYMEPEWQDAFRFAGTRAEELGLEMAIAASPGWSETGGPWVPPEDGLKKLVWSEIVVEGGAPFTGTLPLPPGTTGPFQNILKQPGIAELMGGGAPPAGCSAILSGCARARLPGGGSGPDGGTAHFAGRQRRGRSGGTERWRSGHQRCHRAR